VQPPADAPALPDALLPGCIAPSVPVGFRLRGASPPSAGSASIARISSPSETCV
jgi:hypothetical protein